ncbi:SDR family NAD(P)-dependent oxidoreductase [Novosphingobium album (ex Hu et al. 2023)]|uniref:SDR family oxidoreductase n=1 Tax=Novosphingobium album (ex Hu et al. 2023) TaxID=2930093 RepID=A0ABT0B300_9SPHN|nr:SDR family oxidoreductase [Novosphingobium album (ex Hu et al. 2023)]MCJ2179296.1 SDR family oxidoreductase [Novosphingobium album (ex Hu et al. 2023)]
MTLAIDLTRRTILVCGVARGGIGGATCRQLARSGATIIALDKDAALIAPTVEDVEALGGTIHPMVVDLMDKAACEGVIAQIFGTFGGLDGLANVAGGTREGEWMPLDETPTDAFWQTFQLNLGYIFALCRDAAKTWIDRGERGAIVNVSSVSSLTSAPWHGPYGAAKSGITALTRTMANEWHEFGIRANSVLPGAVATERVLTRVVSENVVQGSEQNFCPPEELANAIVFLLSDLASGISGQSLTVDRSLSTKFCAGARKSRKQIEAEKQEA